MKNLLMLIFLQINFLAFAQGFTIGLKGGLNYSNFTGEKIEEFNFNYATNFHLGLASQIKFTDKFKLQVDVLYNAIGTKIETAATQFEEKEGFITVPLALKHAFITKSTYLEGGAQASFLLKNNDRVELQEFIDARNELEYAVFAGLSVHVTKSLFIQGRYFWSINSVSEVSNLKSEGAQLSLGWYIF